MNKVKVGILGFGTVGAGVASCLLENKGLITQRSDIEVELTKIVDLDITTDRGVKVPKEILSTDAEAMMDEVDIVVELIGGIGVAKKLIEKALKKGKHVVTANKALLAKHGNDLFSIAEENGADIFYEASVAGGIPVIKALREGLTGNKIQRIIGILNGTCNYILTKMERESIDFNTVLKEAQELGYAEADPSLDIDGFDTAHKTAILASLAYGTWFRDEQVHVEGIRGIELCDIKFALELGYRIKLFGIIKKKENKVQLRVHPALVAHSTLMADISEVYNGVLITGDYSGDSLYYGQGAGRNATASAVVADIIDVALNLTQDSHGRVPAFRAGDKSVELLDMDKITARYYMRLQVVDEPGVIASVTKILGDNGISMSSIFQRECQCGEYVSLLLLTHDAKEGAVNSSITQIESLDCVKGKVVKIRVEDI